MWSKVNTLLKLIIDLKQQTAKILALSPENNGIIFDEWEASLERALLGKAASIKKFEFLSLDSVLQYKGSMG